ncbi:ribosome hibernation-promoting factor, HPF/YfiA family [Culicoidibacter larvae]|uniref:Ribosome hibernation promoting factor n=1 Tax=Culicoidibacter larvae TaxID=2579976 RepID=A0A5R8QA21_9FIRM|nr:ribosome-associated translation inhibitor RaiA [Culicoidibacter larvae]TLG72707.1 ribosome-associated translation inhibitor RaiA [Culicoidibacter larvae]
MRYSIRGQNVEITPAIKDYVEDKFSKLDKHFHNPDEVEAKVLIKVYHHLQRIEATIHAYKYILRVDEKQENLYAAIDLAVDKLERQIRKNKSRFNKRAHELHDYPEFFTYFEDEAIAESENKDDIVRVKQMEIQPMDAEEAMMQMDLLGHDFFVYRDMEVGKICVLYRRKDGKYAIIEPL